MNLRYLARRLTGRILHTPDIRFQKVTLGTEYGSHTIPASGLSPASVVYSFGIGEDASFDLELIERYGCVVHAFDPTPKSASWVEFNVDEPRFVFEQIGIGAKDGEASFAPPANPNHASWFKTERGEHSFPIKRLSSIMRERGHDRIDLLKVDVEGFEYEIIADIVAVKPSAIAIEFHHRMYGFTNRDTNSAVDALRSSGYRLFHVSPTGREYSFSLG